MHNKIQSIIKEEQPGRVVQPYSFQTDLEALRLAAFTKKDEVAEKQEDKADEAMRKALQQAEEILNIARRECEIIKNTAREEGYRVGFEEGKKAGYEAALRENADKLELDRQEMKSKVNQSIISMEEKKKELLDQYLEDLKNLSIAVAEKVVRVSLKSSGDIIKGMIVSATDKLKKTEWAKIYISKYDAEMMVEGDAQLLNSLSFLSDNIKIITMDQEERGTCIVELPDEIIDLSVTTQLENIKDILNNANI